MRAPTYTLTLAALAFCLSAAAQESHQVPLGSPCDKLHGSAAVEFPAPPKHRKESPAERAARTISAACIGELAREPARVVSVRIKISHAVITGPLKREYASFEYEVSITDTEFTGDVDLSFATFKRAATFDRSTFRTANFRGAHALGDFSITQCRFENESNYQDLHSEEVFSADGANFGQVNFQRIQVLKSAFFRAEPESNPVTFRGRANFINAHIAGNAEFSGAHFTKAADFDGLHVDGNSFFCIDKNGNQAQFVEKASFVAAHINGDASFRGSVFRSDAAFDRFQVDGGAYFQTDAKDRPVLFIGKASFPFARFRSAAYFVQAGFQQGADFRNAHFLELADFRKAKFRCLTDFTDAFADQDAKFQGAKFTGPLDFRDARFRSVLFRDQMKDGIPASNDRQFLTTVDLRGFTYDRVSVAWRELLRALSPYDRQPYTQLEKVFREARLDPAADEVYLERRWAERRQVLWPGAWWRLDSGNWWLWLIDWLFNLMANYGVRPWRLVIVPPVLLLVLGTLIFAGPGAVESAPGQGLPSSVSSAQTSNGIETLPQGGPKLSKADAFRVTARILIPLDVPLARSWTPSDRAWCGWLRFSDVATLLKILEWTWASIILAFFQGWLRPPS